MSRFLTPRPDKQPKPRRSVYEERTPVSAERGWVPIAETDFAGQLRWERDWVNRATGWYPLDAFMRNRGIW
jgi:hypothetical protein